MIEVGTYSPRQVTGQALELLLRPLWPAGIEETPAESGAGSRLVCLPGRGAPRWLRARDWSVFASVDGPGPDGEPLASFALDGGGSRETVLTPAGDVVVPFSLGEAHRAYVAEQWRAGSALPHLSERSLDAFYRVKALIPRRLQLAARRRLIRRQGVPDFPAWPLDTSVSRLLRFYAGCALRAAQRSEAEFLWFWPESFRAAVVLTHDVESDEGVRLALDLAELEEQHGFRSSFNFGAWYRELDPGVLRELSSRGFEIGMHGLTHDRQLFSSRETFEARLQPLAELAERLGAVGFRSPATHRVVEWLGELPIEYDCTIPNSDPYEPQPGGCCSVWPFFLGDVVELPWTLPQDHTLLTLLGHRSADLWLAQAAAVEREHGLIQCLSHPDRGYLADADKRAVYSEFLSGLAERPGLWRALPRDVARWWRRRADATEPGGDIRRGTARLGDTVLDVALDPPV